MSYQQGGLIEATDYNNLINGSNQLNTVLGVGNGDAGYGQTTVGTVAATNDVTATQWTTLINALNNVRAHQTGSGTGISTVTAGQTINYLSTLQTQVDNAYSGRGSYAAQGATVTGTTFDKNNPVTDVALGEEGADTVVTFASANAARYFFNAGGQLNFYLSAQDNNGSRRSSALTRTINSVGGFTCYNNSNSGRYGTGNNLSQNNTQYGYRQMVLNSVPWYVSLVYCNDDGAYTPTYCFTQLWTNSSDTTNGANGATVIFRHRYASEDHSWDDPINVTVRTRVDIVYPSTTYLTDVWGTPSVA